MKKILFISLILLCGILPIKATNPSLITLENTEWVLSSNPTNTKMYVGLVFNETTFGHKIYIDGHKTDYLEFGKWRIENENSLMFDMCSDSEFCCWFTIISCDGDTLIIKNDKGEELIYKRLK